MSRPYKVDVDFMRQSIAISMERRRYNRLRKLEEKEYHEAMMRNIHPALKDLYEQYQTMLKLLENRSGSDE